MDSASGVTAVTQLTHHSDSSSSGSSTGSNGSGGKTVEGASELYVHDINRETGEITIYKVSLFEYFWFLEVIFFISFYLILSHPTITPLNNFFNLFSPPLLPLTPLQCVITILLRDCLANLITVCTLAAFLLEPLRVYSLTRHMSALSM